MSRANIATIVLVFEMRLVYQNSVSPKNINRYERKAVSVRKEFH